MQTLRPSRAPLSWLQSAFIAFLLTTGCAHGFGEAAVSHQTRGCADDDDAEPASVTAVMASQPESTPTKVTSPEEMVQAAAALARGLVAYHRGDYPKAEAALKEAMNLHPFLAPAHLTLAKIYLLRGIAANDQKRLKKGRRMIEMAIRLDPKLLEAQALLALFPEN